MIAPQRPHPDEPDYEAYVGRIIADARDMRARTQEIAAETLRIRHRAKVAHWDAIRTAERLESMKRSAR
jgi:hypothetical protein